MEYLITTCDSTTLSAIIYPTTQLKWKPELCVRFRIYTFIIVNWCTFRLTHSLRLHCLSWRMRLSTPLSLLTSTSYIYIYIYTYNGCCSCYHSATIMRWRIYQIWRKHALCSDTVNHIFIYTRGSISEGFIVIFWP